MKYFITGGCGFIGSNMTNFLLSLGHEVIIYDNLSSGFKKFVNESDNLKIVEGDLLDQNFLNQSLDESIEYVYHFAANADVRFGFENPRRDLEQNTIATLNLLEAMREKNVYKIGFSSTGSVYGEPEVFPTPENAPFPIQTSLYAASKVACEGLISSYCEGYKFEANIFRFVSLLGDHYSHGHVFDFTKSLIKNPNELKVLGNGKQTKSYVNVNDCIEAMYLSENNNLNKINIYNIGDLEFITVKESIEIITNFMNVNPKIIFGEEKRGWIGDSPMIQLDNKKIKSLGWKHKFSIRQSIEQTVRWLLNNRWVYEKRS